MPNKLLSNAYKKKNNDSKAKRECLLILKEKEKTNHMYYKMTKTKLKDIKK